jgi:hypothetical protein
MNIAICLYGMSPFESRTYGNTFPYNLPIEDEYKFGGKSYPSLKTWKENILNINQTDVYMHSWTTDEDMQKVLINTFNPIRYQFEPVIHDDIITSCCLSMYKSTELLEKEYDLVFLCRMDVVWFRPIILSETFDPKKFTVSYYRWWDQFSEMSFRKIPVEFCSGLYGSGHYGTSDIFFMANSHNMKKFTNLYNEIDKCSFYKTYSGHDHHLIKRWQINQTGLIEIIDRKLNPGLTSDDNVPNIDFNIESRVFSFTHTRIA